MITNLQGNTLQKYANQWENLEILGLLGASLQEEKLKKLSYIELREQILYTLQKESVEVNIPKLKSIFDSTCYTKAIREVQ